MKRTYVVRRFVREDYSVSVEVDSKTPLTHLEIADVTIPPKEKP